MSALRALVLRKKIDSADKQLEAKKAELEELRSKEEEFTKREAELAQAVEEVTEETSEEDKAAVDESVSAFEEEKKDHDEKTKSVTEEIEQIESEIADSEKELADIEEAQEDEEPVKAPEKEERGKEMPRTNLTGIEARTAFANSEAGAAFCDNVRALARGQKIEQRGVTGADLAIPETLLAFVRSNVEKYSKLYKYVTVRKVSGTARQPIVGDIPEAIWTEMCAAINELSVTFTDIEVDGYKEAGFLPICNATLEDTNDNLVAEITELLTEGLGYALDKAIVYGTGSKMPTGFANNATKTKTTATEGVALFKGLAKACKSIKHSRGTKFWVMNESTKMDLVAESLSVNAAGAIVAGVNDSMPVIGGAIEVLDFIPDGEILGGYGACYLLAERSGASITKSTEVKFIEDQTVFKASARYDGKPIFNDAFVAVAIGATNATGTLDSKHPFAGTTTGE